MKGLGFPAPARLEPTVSWDKVARLGSYGLTFAGGIVACLAALQVRSALEAQEWLAWSAVGLLVCVGVYIVGRGLHDAFSERGDE